MPIHLQSCILQYIYDRTASSRTNAFLPCSSAKQQHIHLSILAHMMLQLIIVSKLWNHSKMRLYIQYLKMYQQNKKQSISWCRKFNNAKSQTVNKKWLFTPSQLKATHPLAITQFIDLNNVKLRNELNPFFHFLFHTSITSAPS